MLKVAHHAESASSSGDILNSSVKNRVQALQTGKQGTNTPSSFQCVVFVLGENSLEFEPQLLYFLFHLQSVQACRPVDHGSAHAACGVTLLDSLKVLEYRGRRGKRKERLCIISGYTRRTVHVTLLHSP